MKFIFSYSYILLLDVLKENNAECKSLICVMFGYRAAEVKTGMRLTLKGILSPTDPQQRKMWSAAPPHNLMQRSV